MCALALVFSVIARSDIKAFPDQSVICSLTGSAHVCGLKDRFDQQHGRKFHFDQIGAQTQ